jgi:hypothetical protein
MLVVYSFELEDTAILFMFARVSGGEKGTSEPDRQARIIK